ncbi:MAG: Trp biosynthesis-associated membrane protein [Actinomycetota bacterium]
MTPRRLTPRQVKNGTLIAGILLAGLVLLTWTGTWFQLVLDGESSSHSSLTVTGSTAAPGLIALALAGLALVGALAIGGPVVRAVLGVVEVLLGFTVVFSAVVALQNPATASESLITGATGISGSAAIEKLVTSVTVTAWPWLAAVAGLLLMALGVFIVITGRRWPGSSNKYQAVRLESQQPGENPAADWDSLSGGDDPTSR